MHVGKTLFAQVMEFVPWKTFWLIIARHHGDAGVRTLASAKTLVFLTNNTALPALTIAALYQHRWQIELFFKWIKQHLRIKRFFGTSENAVKTQIWCAIATYVLIAIVKHERQLDASLHTCLQVLSVARFEKIDLVGAVQPDRASPSPQAAALQFLLFDP